MPKLDVILLFCQHGLTLQNPTEHERAAFQGHVTSVKQLLYLSAIIKVVMSEVSQTVSREADGSTTIC